MSQESIHGAVGSNAPVAEKPSAAWLLRLVVLFCREKVGTPATLISG